jgi:hypothetical protein
MDLNNKKVVQYKLAAAKREFWKVKGGNRVWPVYRNRTAGRDKLFLIMKALALRPEPNFRRVPTEGVYQKVPCHRFLREAS